MEKRKVIVFFVLVGSLAICALVGVVMHGMKKQREAEEEERAWWPGEQEAYTLTEEYPTDIIWFGTTYPFGYEVNIRYEYELTEETLRVREGFEHAYIVLSDRNGALNVTEEQLRMIKNLVATDKRYNFVYIGTEANPIFEEIGFKGMKLDLTGVVSYSEMNVEGKVEALADGVPNDVDYENLWMYILANLADEWTY